MAKERDLSQRQTFEKYGETWVHHLMLTTDNRDDKAQASSWLEEKRIEREVEASSKRDAREEETLAIAKEANLLASEANSFARLQAVAASRSARYAMYAAAIAATVAIAGYKDQIFSIIENYL
jgi:hypothetical protein